MSEKMVGPQGLQMPEGLWNELHGPREQGPTTRQDRLKAHLGMKRVVGFLKQKGG